MDHACFPAPLLGALQEPGPGLQAQPCVCARVQDNILLDQLELANLLYQHQLTPPASQSVPVVMVPLGRGCNPHALACCWGTQRGAGCSHTGEWWLWSPYFPRRTSSGLVFLVVTSCPPVPALLLVVLLLLSLSLPLPTVLPCCVHRQGTNSPSLPRDLLSSYSDLLI